MIDPEHLNDLKEMTVGYAARAAFLHAASANGYTENSFPPLLLDLCSLLADTVGETCTSRDVTSATCIWANRKDDERGPDNNVIEGDFDHSDDEDSPYQVVPVEKFVREAAAALAALSTYHVGERVLIGWHRATAVPAVIVGQVDEDYWLVADSSGDTPREVDFGLMWHAPLAEPTPFPAARDNHDHPGGVA